MPSARRIWTRRLSSPKRRPFATRARSGIPARRHRFRPLRLAGPGDAAAPRRSDGPAGPARGARSPTMNSLRGSGACSTPWIGRPRDRSGRSPTDWRVVAHDDPGRKVTARRRCGAGRVEDAGDLRWRRAVSAAEARSRRRLTEHSIHCRQKMRPCGRCALPVNTWGFFGSSSQRPAFRDRNDGFQELRLCPRPKLLLEIVGETDQLRLTQEGAVQEDAGRFA